MKKHVAETATRFTKMLDDMATLLEALREKLDDVELKISFVKKRSLAVATTPMFPTKSRSLN